MAPDDITPRPDSTRLTTEQIDREVLWLRELLEQRIGSLEDLVETRFSERDGRFIQIESTLAERGQRLAAIEVQTQAFHSQIVAIAAERKGGAQVIPWLIGTATLVLGALGLLITHIIGGK